MSNMEIILQPRSVHIKCKSRVTIWEILLDSHWSITTENFDINVKNQHLDVNVSRLLLSPIKESHRNQQQHTKMPLAEILSFATRLKKTKINPIHLDLMWLQLHRRGNLVKIQDSSNKHHLTWRNRLLGQVHGWIWRKSMKTRFVKRTKTSMNWQPATACFAGRVFRSNSACFSRNRINSCRKTQITGNC